MTFGYRAIILSFTAIMLLSVLNLGWLTYAQQSTKQYLSQRQMRQDLKVLFNEIEQHSAFYSIQGLKLQKKITQKINQIDKHFPHRISREHFGAETTKLMALLADPGASVIQPDLKTSKLPIGLRPMQSQWLALNHQGETLNLEYPFLAHIDDIPISTWALAAARYLPPQMRRSKNLLRPWLQQINILRHDIGLPQKTDVSITLANSQGEYLKTQLPLAANLLPIPPALAELPKLNSDTPRVLRITDISRYQHSQKQRLALQQAMLAPNLILDLRQATGFSDWFVATLMKYDRVRRLNQDFVGFGRYRMATDLRSDYLKPLRFTPLHQLSHTNERQAIRITKDIDNTYSQDFSQWFARTLRFEPGFYLPLTNQLTLIIGPQCRQDCQWLAYYAKRWSNAQLIGEATAGDLARKYYIELPYSGLKISMSGSLSYDNQGQRITGISTQPDIDITFDEHSQWQSVIKLAEKQQRRQSAVLAAPSEQ
ncbi:S41 family peptidase [Shewanella gelidii]|uniref:Tail specific protease domain-containing protein n=1 Tax=Shewanella gelidii TaxID=1642821 RepID=A0A917JIW9_9GAMM|nr:S41 family peptidase [Shewanella gelidii]MCL1096852.1 S41 family peptidase [Shewanella gelidii]GGI70623.1 hypothetical protein GCM10009332_04900 [Shewanella gelidii]